MDTAIRQPGQPLPNVWLGVSVENQQAADERIPLLLETPATIRFLSCEPLLSPLDLTSVRCLNGAITQKGFEFNPAQPLVPINALEAGIDWVIIGGESGPNARPCFLQWIRDIIQQCQAAEVAVFVKQLGSHAYDWDLVNYSTQPGTHSVHFLNFKDRKGGEIDEWTEELRLRQFPMLNVSNLRWLNQP